MDWALHTVVPLTNIGGAIIDQWCVKVSTREPGRNNAIERSQSERIGNYLIRGKHYCVDYIRWSNVQPSTTTLHYSLIWKLNRFGSDLLYVTSSYLSWRPCQPALWWLSATLKFTLLHNTILVQCIQHIKFLKSVKNAGLNLFYSYPK